MNEENGVLEQITFEKAINLLMEKLVEWGKDVIVMLPNLVIALLIIVLAIIVAKLVGRVLEKILEKISDHSMINRLALSIVNILIIVAGILISLSILQLDGAVTALLGSAGIIGLALGFAFQDITANFISGIIIAVRRPFKVGDILETNDFFGVISRIDLRTTQIYTPQGQEVLIPNKEVFQNPIINYSTGSRRIDLEVGVSYGDDLAKASQITIEAIEKLEFLAPNKKVNLYYKEFGGSSINFVIYYWINFKTQADYLRAVSEGIKSIHLAYDKNDITIPFPIRTLDFGIKGGEKLNNMLIDMKSNGSSRD